MVQAGPQCRRLSAEAAPDQGQSAYHLYMNAIRLRHLIAVAGVLTASAVLGAPTALAQPVPCPADPANAAQPGNGACTSPDSMYGPISGENPGSPPGTLPGPISQGPPPGMPGSGIGG